jgi:hypothetical protein
MPVGQEFIRSLPTVLRPGVLIPVVCYAATLRCGIAALVLAMVAPEAGARTRSTRPWRALSATPSVRSGPSTRTTTLSW